MDRRFPSIVIVSVIATLLINSLPLCGHADVPVMARILPQAFHQGWIAEAKTSLYDRDNLFEHINGEAELYTPYRFDLLATANYSHKKYPEVRVVADVYRMGSLLDAFGIYSNYRKPEYEAVKIGAEGFISLTQMMFYQDRYFVRLQATGTTKLEREIFWGCAQMISANLPANAMRPEEAGVFNLPPIVPKSERYIAQSLLGYDFFRKGLIADAVVAGGTMRIFIVFEDNGEAARKAFNAYYAFLKEEGRDTELLPGAPEQMALTATDALYGGVVAELSARYIIGAVKVRDRKAARELIGKLRQRIQDTTEKPDKR